MGNCCLKVHNAPLKLLKFRNKAQNLLQIIADCLSRYIANCPRAMADPFAPIHYTAPIQHTTHDQTQECLLMQVPTGVTGAVTLM